MVAFSLEGTPDERLCVVAELRDAKAPRPPELLDALVQAIAEAHELRPDLLVLSPPGAIPKTSSGKLQRSRCKALLMRGELAELTRWERPKPLAQRPLAVKTPAELEKRLLQWLAQTLGMDAARLDPEQPFARYGMDSALAVAMTEHLSELLHRSLAPTLAWEYATPRQLVAQLLEGGIKAAPQTPPQKQIRTQQEEPIAIIGIGCRFPGGVVDAETFWTLLAEGRDTISPVPPSRWSLESLYDAEPGTPGKLYVREGGFLSDIDQFEPARFGISPREAHLLDPQQRLLLEVALETLELAGSAPQRLQGAQVGVFVGMSTQDYAQVLEEAGVQDVYRLTGSVNSVEAGRLAYTFGFHGPTMVLDTACSSSLVAVHQACQSLRAGECELALAGGVQLMLTPQSTLDLCAVRALSPSGRCRTFAADADGYIRSEGCGMVLLKPLSAAQRDGDHIWGLIRSSAINQDGKSNGLTAPNGAAQVQLLRRALARAGLPPSALDVVETHGTGTKLGDPIELRALAEVFGGDAERHTPLLLGALKSQLGHTEAAAGIAGLLKLVLALRHETLPGNLHTQTLTPLLPWQKLPLEVLQQPRSWPRGSRIRRAGLSSFGLSGTNAHLILEEAPQQTVPTRPSARPPILVLSGQSMDTVKALAARYVAQLESNHLAWSEMMAWSAATSRATLETRAACVASDVPSLVQKLKA
ncbi:MAG: beta-ketoacyl synthase N-terminal-like domain-containing protein [Myxococcota bacterium]